MDNGRFTRAMLLDFYGELLTDKQRDCFDLYYNQDLSLSEIAEDLSISRQGVWDNIRRADAALQVFENKTGLLERFEKIDLELDRLQAGLDRLAEICTGEAKPLAEQLAAELKTFTDRG